MHFTGRNEDDRSKSYNRWFQFDILGENYRKPKGKQFRMDDVQGWSMKASMHINEEMEKSESTQNSTITCQGAMVPVPEDGVNHDSEGAQKGW